MTKFLFRTLLAALILLSTSIKADSWLPPKTKLYYSANKNYMLKVVPRFTPERYYEWKAAAKHNRQQFNENDSDLVACHAVLYHIANADTLQLWKADLINSLAPANAIVADDGSSVVTFDNWGSVGTDDQVMVMYGHQGNLIKAYSLEDISPIPLSEFYQTVSSVWWRCDVRYTDAKTIEIQFCDRNSKRIPKKFKIP